jgi:hypothetical protein
MKIIKRRVYCTPIEFNTANNLIKVSTNYSNGPEITLEDNSIFIFNDSLIYYNIIIDSKFKKDTLDPDILELKYLTNKDDVLDDIVYNDKKVTEVHQYIYKGTNIYRFITE